MSIKAFVWVLALGLLAADCGGPQVQHNFGFVELGGKVAVYTPICPGDEVRSMRVYEAPDPVKGGDFVLLWEVADPVTAPAREGLITLGGAGQFATTAHAPPDTFPRRLSIDVVTVAGRLAEEARERAADLPRYDAGTPVGSLEFETDRGRRSSDQLRAGLAGCA